MKKYLLLYLLALLPVLSFGSSYNGIDAHDVCLCKKGCWLENFWSWDWVGEGDVVYVWDTPFTRFGSYDVELDHWNGQFPVFNHGNDTEYSDDSRIWEIAGTRSQGDLFVYKRFSEFLKNRKYFQYMGNRTKDPNISIDIRKK